MKQGSAMFFWGGGGGGLSPHQPPPPYPRRPYVIHYTLMCKLLAWGRRQRGVFECDIAHRRSVVVLCMLYQIRCNPMHPLFGALPGQFLPVGITRGDRVAHGILMHLLAAEPRNAAGPIFHSQYPWGTILLTLYSNVWDCLVLRAGPIVFNWP